MYPVGAAGAPSPEWIGRAPHEELERGAHPAAADRGPVLPAARGLRTRRAGHRAALPRRRAGLSRADPAARHRHPAAVPHHRPQRAAAGHRHHGAHPRGHTPIRSATSCPTSAPSTRCPSRCFPSYALRRRAKAVGSIAQLEYLLVAAALAEGWVVSVPDHEGPDGHVGRPLRTRLRRPRRTAGRPRLRAVRPRRGHPDRVVGLLRRRAGQRVGGRGCTPGTPPN